MPNLLEAHRSNAHRRRVIFVLPPMCRIAYSARPIAVANLSIDEDQKSRRRCRVQHQADASRDANKAFYAATDIMLFNSGAFPRNSRIGDQNVLKLATPVTLGQQGGFAD